MMPKPRTVKLAPIKGSTPHILVRSRRSRRVNRERASITQAKLCATKERATNVIVGLARIRIKTNRVPDIPRRHRARVVIAGQPIAPKSVFLRYNATHRFLCAIGPSGMNVKKRG